VTAVSAIGHVDADLLQLCQFSYANAPEILLALQELADGIERVGLHAWYDRARLVPGRTFEDEIITQVGTSAAVILLASPATFDSRWVLREISTAVAAARPIIPCFLSNAKVPAAFDAVLAKLNRLELFHYARNDWVQALLWSLELNGIHFPWPADLPHALPRIEADIDAIYPPYSVLRKASRREIEELLLRLENAIERNERWGFGYLNLGLAYLHLGDRQRAIEALKGALKHLPRVAECFYFLALALLAFEPLRRARPPWLTEAEEALAVARRLDPANPLFAVLDGVIAVEHYRANGFRRPRGDDGRRLADDIQAARGDTTLGDELDRLAATIPIRDPRLQLSLGVPPG